MTPPDFLANLVGNNFRSAEERAALLELVPGEELTLVRDPENPYDANAIRVEHGSYFLGFVEKFVAAELAKWLDEGIAYAAKVQSLADPKKPLLKITPR